MDCLEQPFLQSAADGEELSTGSAAARCLQAATALRHKLCSRADAAGDARDQALRRNELALLQCHIHWLLVSSAAQLLAAGEHAVSIQRPNPLRWVELIALLGPDPWSHGNAHSMFALYALQTQRMLTTGERHAVPRHAAYATGLTESQARLSKHLAARLVRRCQQQLPSPTLQKAAELLVDSGADSDAPDEDEVSQLCGAAVAADAPPSMAAEEPDALEAVSRAQCSVQASAACHPKACGIAVIQPLASWCVCNVKKGNQTLH